MSDDATRQQAAQWVFKETWGFERVPEPEQMELYAKALIGCANGDGHLAPEERAWVVGFGAALGFPTSFLSELERYEGAEDPAELLGGTEVTSSPGVRLSVIYDAVRACGADGEVSEGERETIFRMASALGVERARVDAVLAQYAKEVDVRKARLELIYGEGGSPY
jgi:uncharacterized membrane protein YebE (DUF533 family)